MNAETPLWTPSRERIASAPMTAFMAAAAERAGQDLSDFAGLHAWSVEDREGFWDLVWDFCGVVGDKGGTVLEDGDKMPGARWFPEARLNYAENLLRFAGPEDALVFWGEDKVKRRLSRDELRAQVSRFQQFLEDAGVQPGDRVAGYLPNLPETLIAMLAAASLGAIWSSASPDFGVQGVLDRFGQIEPTVRVSADGYFYSGKRHSSTDKLPAIVAGMPGVKKVVVVPYTQDRADIAAIPKAEHLADFMAPFAARASVATHRRKPRLGSCSYGTGPKPFQPLRRSWSRPRW